MNASITRSPAELTGQIRRLMVEKLAIGVVSDDVDLLADGILDSVTLVQLILQLEKTFTIRIELSELEIDDLRSVRSIAGLVAKLQVVRVGDLELAEATANTR